MSSALSIRNDRVPRFDETSTNRFEFEEFCATHLAHLDEVPATDPDASPVQRVTDYIAGMTDRFCLSTYEQLTSRQ